MTISRRGAVDPFIVMDVMEEARKLEMGGQRIIHMEVGQPGTPAPKKAREKLSQLLETEIPLGYTVSLGIPELRQKIATLYKTWYGLDIDPNRVVVTAGASGAFLLAFSLLFDAGDRVGVSEPGYPSYRQILKALSLNPVGIQASAESRLQLTPDDMIDSSYDIKGLIVASPANPSGTMLSRDALLSLSAYCREHKITLISDEIYHGLHYEDRAVCALEVYDDAWIINSFSKYFSMTGWRVGWMVVPDRYVRAIERLAQNMFICAPHASQFVALHALDCMEELEKNRAVYAKNRLLAQQGLQAAGLNKFAPPDGAFYIYADMSDITQDSLGFSRRLLHEAGLAATPGIDFDPVRGHKTLRFSYARDHDYIAEGMERLKSFMKYNL